jgi:threonine dehydrogenase-like Zn-dependent dehydrogenase
MRGITFHIDTAKWFACKALGVFDPKVYWSRVSTLRLADIPPQPLPADDWVRVAPRLGGICGSDLSLITLGTPPDAFARALVVDPIVLGHESVGLVVERGPGAQDVPQGLRVNVDPAVACAARGLDPCPSCREGQFYACWNMGDGHNRGLGYSVGHSARLGGSWSDSFVAHKSQLIAVPDGLSDEQAILTDPLSTCVHAVLRRPPGLLDQDILVMGCGIVGLGIIAFLRDRGFQGRILATARYRSQQALALELGASDVWNAQDLQQRDLFDCLADLYRIRPIKGLFGRKLLLGGVDLIYDAVGARGTVEDSLRLVRPQGTVVIVGMGHPRWVDWDPIPHKQLTVVGVHGRGQETWQGRACHTYEIVHDLLASGRFPAARLLTHTFSLEDYATALDVMTHKGRHGAVHGAFRISG